MKKILFIIIAVISSFEILADQNNLFSKKNNQILPAEEAFGFNLKKMNQIFDFAIGVISSKSLKFSIL